MPRPSTMWPRGPRNVFFDDYASRPTIAAALRRNEIRRIAKGVLTADQHSDPAEIVATNVWEIVAHEMPDAIVVDRTAAADGRIEGGIVTISTDNRRKPLELPGVTVLVRPLERHATDLPWSNGLSAAAPACVLVDNLTISRTRAHLARTLSTAELQDWLARKQLAWGDARTERLRVEALTIAEERARPDQCEEIERLFGELRGERPLRESSGDYARATVAGTAWDPDRVKLFEQVAEQLRVLDTERLPAPVPDGELPFFEAYFSNYIEGTEFTVEDAREIVNTNTPPARRPADGHDILGTFRCVVDHIGRATVSDDADELVNLMRMRHRTMLAGRPEIEPGEFKDANNRVGTLEFVDHRLVTGTLLRGLSSIAELPVGLARAIYAMFVVTEVHPFVDGNGRVARLMMNAELSALGACRIVVPTVLRDEYIGSLRRASTADGDIAALRRVLEHAWRWSAAMPWNDTAATDGQMHATNALTDSAEAAYRHLTLTLP